MKKLAFGEIGAAWEREGKSSKLPVSLKDPNEDDDIRSLDRDKRRFEAKNLGSGLRLHPILTK